MAQKLAPAEKIAHIYLQHLQLFASLNCQKIRAKIVAAICNKTWVRKVKTEKH